MGRLTFKLSCPPARERTPRDVPAANGTPSMGPKLFSDPIDKQLDAAAALADVYVEPLLVHEQFADLAQETPPRPFVKRFGADVRQIRLTPRTLHGIDGVTHSRPHDVQRRKCLVSRRSATSLVILPP